MSDLNEKDIAEYQKNKEKQEYLEDNPLIKTTVGHDLWEWSKLITELSEKEVELGNVKEEYNRKEFEILASFDFKKVYGKDNEKIRKAHVHNELFDLDTRISDLELSTKYITHRISYLKSLIRVKAVIMEVKE